MNDKTDGYNVTAEADQAHDDKWLADQVVALGLAERWMNMGAQWYRLTNRTMSMSAQEKNFVRDPRVAMALMEVVYEKRYSFMVMQLPDKKPMMTIQAPIQTAGEYADPSTRNSWASQVANESLPRSIVEACVDALS